MHSTSHPLMLKSHIRSSSLVSRKLSAPSFSTFSMTSFFLSWKLLPAMASSSTVTFPAGNAGLSVQIFSDRSFSYTTLMCLSSSFSSYSFPAWTEITLPSNPRVWPSCIFFSRNSVIVGTPSSRMRNRVTPVPSSSCSAWIKYLPSVQSPAPSCHTSSVPLEPVNPQKYSLTLKKALTYSELW